MLRWCHIILGSNAACILLAVWQLWASTCCAEHGILNTVTGLRGEGLLHKMSLHPIGDKLQPCQSRHTEASRSSSCMLDEHLFQAACNKPGVTSYKGVRHVIQMLTVHVPQGVPGPSADGSGTGARSWEGSEGEDLGHCPAHAARTGCYQVEPLQTGNIRNIHRLMMVHFKPILQVRPVHMVSHI